MTDNQKQPDFKAERIDFKFNHDAKRPSEKYGVSQERYLELRKKGQVFIDKFNEGENYTKTNLYEDVLNAGETPGEQLFMIELLTHRIVESRRQMNLHAPFNMSEEITSWSQFFEVPESRVDELEKELQPLARKLKSAPLSMQSIKQHVKDVVGLGETIEEKLFLTLQVGIKIERAKEIDREMHEAMGPLLDIFKEIFHQHEKEKIV